MKIRMQRIALTILSVVLIEGMIPNTASYARPRTFQDGGALSLPEGKAGQTYEYQLRSEGGLTPLTWRVVAGELPPGISLEASGKLTGVPTTPRLDASSFVVEVSDSSAPPQRFAQPFRLLIRAAPLRILADVPKLKIVPTTQREISSPLAPNPKSKVRMGEQSIAAAEMFGMPASNEAASGTGSANNVGKVKNPDIGKPAGETTTIHGIVSLASLKNPRSGFYNKTPAEIRSAPQPRGATERKQKEFVENHLNNLIVQAQDKDNKLIATTLTNLEGEFTLVLPSIPTDGKVTFSTEADDYLTRRTLLVTSGFPSPTDSLVLEIEDRPVSLLTRAVVGFSQAGASSAKADQNYFFDLYINKSFPFKQTVDPNFGERVKTWGDVRIASVPQQITTGIGEFVGGFTQNVANLKVNEIAQALEFLAGVEVRLTGNEALLPSFDRETKQKFSLSFVAGFGTTTPLDPKSQIELFKVFPGAPGLPPEAKDKKYVAFVPSDRDRFFRQYYAGFRINTFFFNRNNVPTQRFPGMLDIMYGQNEFVTGGRLRGGVFRLDGYFPLPFEQLKFINLFATALLRPGRTKISTPLILEPVDTAKTPVTVPGPDVAIVPFPQINRDYYRVGAGIDFMSFVQAMKNLGKKP